VSVDERLEGRIRGTRLGESRSAEREGNEDGALNHPNVAWCAGYSIFIPQIEEASELRRTGRFYPELFIGVRFMSIIDPYSLPDLQSQPGP
jgi:hypothetical protein